MTNFERIKAMTVEEMAEFLSDMVGEPKSYVPCGIACEYDCGVIKTKDCIAKIKQWLENEVQEDDR